jgi:hypothetical protein
MVCPSGQVAGKTNVPVARTSVVGNALNEAPGAQRVNRIRQVPFDQHCVEPVCDAIGGEWSLAPFRLPGGAVYQLTVPDKEGRPAVMLTIWPTLKRIDAISSSATVVFTDVLTVDLVGDVEVQFRRGNRDLLIVARGGKVIVRA